MNIITDTTAKTLTEFIRLNIALGSTIWTDASRSYNQSERVGYVRRTTVAKDNSDPLPTLGRVTTNLKRWLNRYAQGRSAVATFTGLPQRVRVPVQPPSRQKRAAAVPTGLRVRHGHAASDLSSARGTRCCGSLNERDSQNWG